MTTLDETVYKRCCTNDSRDGGFPFHINEWPCACECESSASYAKTQNQSAQQSATHVLKKAVKTEHPPQNYSRHRVELVQPRGAILVSQMRPLQKCLPPLICPSPAPSLLTPIPMKHNLCNELYHIRAPSNPEMLDAGQLLIQSSMIST